METLNKTNQTPLSTLTQELTLHLNNCNLCNKAQQKELEGKTDNYDLCPVGKTKVLELNYRLGFFYESGEDRKFLRETNGKPPLRQSKKP